MILITGAGGKTGKALVKWLSKQESVCALVRREEHVSTLKSLGAERVIVGDMKDEQVIQSAIQNVRAIYHICPNMNPNEVQIGKLMIKAARENGVGHFVYHSVLHPQIEAMPHHWDKMRVEEMLFESGIPFTILQPAPYMQNLLTNWKSITEDGVLRVPYSVDSKFSFVDLEDIVQTASIIFKDQGYIDGIYELVGTDPLSHAEVAEIFGEVLNRNVRAEKEEISDWKLHTTELNEHVLTNLVKMFEYYSQYGLIGNMNVLRWVLKREPTSIKSYLERVVDEGAVR